MPRDYVNKLLVGELEAVYRLAYHLCGRHHEVDDLVQETYLRAFKAGDKFQVTDGGPRPWLFKILHNVIYSRYAADGRKASTLARMALEDPPPDSESNHTNINLADLQWDTIDEQLKQALHELPLAWRMTFLLYAVEGLKYREIAAVTEVPVGTVMSRLHRARADLASRLAKYGREQGWSNQRAEKTRRVMSDVSIEPVHQKSDARASDGQAR